MKGDFANKKILVLGLGKSGQAAASLLLFLKAQVYATDDALVPPKESVTALEQEHLKLIDRYEACRAIKEFDAIVVSPGVPKQHPCYMAAIASSQLILGEVELAAQFLTKAVCIGITGTNGKTTCTLFLEHLLQQAGIRALAVGNVGMPLSAIAEAFCRKQALAQMSASIPFHTYTHFIIELSSFQLETMHTPFLDVAVLLNITADHLDRYANFDDYAQTKFKIFKCLKPTSPAFIEQKAFKCFPHLATTTLHTYGYHKHNTVAIDDERIYLHQQPEAFLPLPLRGVQHHDIENFMACYAVGRALGLAAEHMISAFFSFKKPPHRIEFVAEIDGINFIDDSKGTNIDAVCRAVQSLSGNIILIAGGVDKGASYVPWIASFAGKVRYICAIGQAAGKIEQELSAAIPVRCFAGLADAVWHARAMAHKGDTVLLSPGCASYDLFIDYAHRGREFKRIINQLRGGNE